MGYETRSHREHGGSLMVFTGISVDVADNAVPCNGFSKTSVYSVAIKKWKWTSTKK